MMKAEIPPILIEKLIYLRDQCLEQGGNGDCVINASRNIADAKLQRWDEWMWRTSQ